jgi:RNA-directed DNA polymerase
MIVEKLARDTGVPAQFVIALANGASHEYKTYDIPKRHGGKRTIHHPSRRLKALQRWLLRNVIERLPVHPAAAAYRPGLSIFDNAKKHTDSRYLLRMDFAKFFPSITIADIGRYIAERRSFFTQWSSADIDVFCQLVCRDSALTIGAPTSPALSNVLCFDLDSELERLCGHFDVTYTRYADDLFFSALQPDVLQEIEKQVPYVVSKLSIPANLTVNAAKTRHSSKRGARRVTGVVLGSDGKAYVGRSLKRHIRALIHRFDTLDANGKAHLAGLLAYAIGFDANFLNSLFKKYGSKRMKQVRAHQAAPK